MLPRKKIKGAKKHCEGRPGFTRSDVGCVVGQIHDPTENLTHYLNLHSSERTGNLSMAKELCIGSWSPTRDSESYWSKTRKQNDHSPINSLDVTGLYIYSYRFEFIYSH